MNNFLFIYHRLIIKFQKCFFIKDNRPRSLSVHSIHLDFSIDTAGDNLLFISIFYHTYLIQIKHYFKI